VANTPIHQIGDEADLIKINFYKKHKNENERRRKKFIEEGGNMEDFRPKKTHWKLNSRKFFISTANCGLNTTGSGRRKAGKPESQIPDH
jgi:hypothetical protein